MKAKLRAYVNRKFLLYPKTPEILELREELFSMMYDKYDDCLKSGLSEVEGYQHALAIMADYRVAIKEVERGSSHSALKKKLLGFLAFTAFYFVLLTTVYLIVSMVVLNSFERTWLMFVGGAFLYVICFFANLFSYAKMFDKVAFSRISLGLLFLGFIPLLYVFPSLFSFIMYGHNVWVYSWLVVPAIVLLYLIADLIIFRKNTPKAVFAVEFVITGFLVTTVFYLCTSYFFNLWHVAWIAYVLYLAIVALALYVSSKKMA